MLIGCFTNWLQTGYKPAKPKTSQDRDREANKKITLFLMEINQGKEVGKNAQIPIHSE